MEIDLLLINPPITLEERYGTFASVGSQAPPLGLCYVAATVRDAGYRVQIKVGKWRRNGTGKKFQGS